MRVREDGRCEREQDAWEHCLSFSNLRGAAFSAALGKRRRGSAARFLERLEPELLALERELRSGSWRPGTPTVFVIRDPKERRISAAPFRDRVVHHALVRTLEPRFDASLVPESFACRKGKGTHQALLHAMKMAQSVDWFLKFDIAKCFESIPHRAVRAVLERLVPEQGLRALCERVLAGHDAPKHPDEGRGLPIGNLTSQWFANLVLDRIDRCLLSADGVYAYARYMDDFLVGGFDKATLRAILERAQTRAGELGLRLKPEATRIAPCRQGIPFLGWQVLPALVRLRPENARRLRGRLRQRRWEWRHGLISGESYAASVRSVLTHASFGSTLAWRRKLIEEMRLNEEVIDF